MQKEPSAALCDGSFTELECWGQSVHTLSMRIRTHRHTHEGPRPDMQPTYMRACTYTQSSHRMTLLCPGRHRVNRVGRWRGQAAQTWFAMLPRDMSEGTFPSVRAHTQQSFLEELMGPVQGGRQESELEDGPAPPAM